MNTVLQMSRAPAPCTSGRVVQRPQRSHFFSGGALRNSAAAAAQSRGPKRCTVAKANDVLGSSYATALVELAQESDSLDKVHQDMDALASVLSEDAEVKDHFANPVVPDADKIEMIEKLAKEIEMHENTKNFLGLLVQARRFDVIDEIITAFENTYCKMTDTQVATLTSAVKLEQEQQFLIAKKLQELTGSKNIKLKPVVDDSLIAGFIVEYGSSQIDLSVRGQLNKIANELEASQAAA